MGSSIISEKRKLWLTLPVNLFGHKGIHDLDASRGRTR